MIFECGAIILIIIMLSFMSYRGGQRGGWSIGVLPLLLVPTGHIIGIWICRFIAGIFAISTATAWLGIDLFMLMITCLILGVISLRIKRRSLRIAYLAVCGIYSAILTCVLIVRSILT